MRKWQQAAFDVWGEHRPADALIVATPGAGKTRFAARVAHAVLADRGARRVLIVVPREHLKLQVARALGEADISLDHRFTNAAGSLASDVHGAVVTYQQVAAAPRLFARLSEGATVLLDEIHHAGDDASWGTALRSAFGGATHRVALSGTPFRSDGTAIPFIQYVRGISQPDFSYDYAAALADGVCRALVFPLHGGETEWISRDGKPMQATFASGLSRQHEGERLRTALTQADWVGDVIAKAHLRLLAIRAGGQPDAGGLVAAMNQEHARFIADLMQRRIGVTPAIVVSDFDDASSRITAFANSQQPWIVAVHMVSEGVDIPRLRVGVFASNVVTEMYFRQFCGRFVRTKGTIGSDREAFVFVPDDYRIRALAAQIAVDANTALKEQQDAAVERLTCASATERHVTIGLYASVAARAVEGSTLNLGPLFNPTTIVAPSASAASARSVLPAPVPPVESSVETHGERKERMRKAVAGLVAHASATFTVSHKLVHATLNMRCGGRVTTASIAELDQRRKIILQWLARRTYDGLR